MDSNPETQSIDSISQEMEILAMDPADQRIAREPEQQNTEEYAAKIALETSLPDADTSPMTLISGSQQVRQSSLLPEIMYHIIKFLDFEDDVPTIICVALASKLCRDLVATLIGLHFTPPGEEREEKWFLMGRNEPWNLTLKQRLELAPLLKDWAGVNYRPADPKTITVLGLAPHDQRFWEAPNVMLLSRAAYGDTWMQEFALPQRHADYHNMILPFTYNFVPHTPYFPPPLRNKVDWYEEMAKFIVHEYIMGEWNEEGNTHIGAWFDPERVVCAPPYDSRGLCNARREFWSEYMHSSLRAWVHHEGPSKFEGMGDGNGFIVSNEDSLVKVAYDIRVRPHPWTYNGRDNFHRSICLEEGATTKQMLRAIEKDIIYSWGPLTWEEDDSD
ncbi:hypothetical protein ACHAP3_003762 [Botrytis cinerea]